MSADEIVNGAFDVARGISLDKLSMPGLAEHLGVGVTSIYWYFRKKEELLNAMTDVAARKYAQAIPPPEPGETWQQTLRGHFTAHRRVLSDDATLADLLLIRTSTYSRDATRRVYETEEAVLAVLVGQGFTADNALRVYNAVSVYARGMVIHDRILRLSQAPTVDGGHRQRRMADWHSMPILDGLIDKRPLAGTTDEDFAFGIEQLIRGFEQLLTNQEADHGACHHR
jgi:AcrR family transcriptional regulator